MTEHENRDSLKKVVAAELGIENSTSKDAIKVLSALAIAATVSGAIRIFQSLTKKK